MNNPDKSGSRPDKCNDSANESVTQPTDKVIRYSRGANRYDNRPEQRAAADFSEFAEACLSDRASQKGEQYICAPMGRRPHAHNPGKYPGEGHYRQKVGAEPTNWLAEDLDGFREGDEALAAKRTAAYFREGFAGFAYTTASHTPEKPRLRAILYCSRYMTREERITVANVVEREFKETHGEDTAKFDTSVYRPEQPVYLPLKRSKAVWFKGGAIDVDAVLERAKPEDRPKPKGGSRAANDAADQGAEVNPFASMVIGDGTGISKPDIKRVKDAWNDKHDVREYLIAQGYEDHGDRLLAPGSKSDPGVTINKDGTIWSDHESDPLAGAPRDAFDCYRILEHGGDWGKALDGARKALGLATEGAGQALQGGDTLPNGKNADILNGELFATMHRGKLLFVHETGDVLAFRSETGYVRAEPEADMRAAKAVTAHLQGFVSARFAQLNGEEPGKKLKRIIAHVDRSSTAPKLRAMIDVARSEDGMTCRMTDLDADPMQLGLPNGVLNLRTCTLLPTTPDLLVTQRCRARYDPSATAPMFQQFLREVIPDRDVRKFLRVFFGYALIGRVDHQLFLFLYGLGANGKSVFIEIIRWVMGDYARKISTEMLMRGQRSPSGPTPDIMGLKGRRLAYANETEEGSRLAESRVKELTGSDTLSARELYGKQVNFEPSHKLVMVGNHRPEIHDDGYGMWRRVALIEFGVTIPESQRDPQLLEKLKAEQSGVLNWMLSGLREYQRNGLVIPNVVKAATDTYRDEMDILGDWLQEKCILKPGATTDRDAVYNSYRLWASMGGHGQLSKSKLTRRLRNRGVTVSADRRNYAGIGLADGAAA